MNGVTIRISVEDDRSIIRQVIQHAWEHDYPHIYTPDEIRRAFNGELGQHSSWSLRRGKRLERLVAVLNQQIIGVIALGTILNDTAGEVVSLYVDPAYHKKGVGGSLWQAGLDILRGHDCDAVWVWVLERAAARTFYEHLGCTQRASGSYQIGSHAEVALGYWRLL